MPRNFDRQDVLGAIEGCGGITLTVATRLGCEWHTADKYIKKWESTKQAFADESDKGLDRAESLIARNIDLGLRIQQETKQPVDSSDAKWLLSRKGKDRGYAERREIAGTGEGGAIPLITQIVANVSEGGDENDV
jgi:hypothetical protein